MGCGGSPLPGKICYFSAKSFPRRCGRSAGPVVVRCSAIHHGIDFVGDSVPASDAEFPARGMEPPCLRPRTTKLPAVKPGDWDSLLHLCYAPYAAADEHGT